jgi:SH3-like domain-containing protein
MSVSLSVRIIRLLLCGMLVAAPGAMAQTPGTQPATQQPKPKQTPVVRPHGPTHAQKPPAKTPAKSPAKAPTATPPVPAPVPPPAQPPAEEKKPAETEGNKGSATGLPLPRYAALRSDEVNLRAGPGTRYPIDWVYKRRDLPVEILREFEVWRLVQDPDGIKGWVHQATLTGRRSFIITGGDATLRRDPKDNASAVAILKPGVIGRMRSCQAGSDWCQVQVGDHRGYLKRGQFWGTLPDEVVTG